MKKLLFFFALACAAVSGYAQLAANQRPVGTYYTDVLPSEGVGNPAEPGQFTVFTAVPLSKFDKIGHAKIAGVRFGLDCSIGASMVHVRPVVYGETKAEIFDDVATGSIATTERGWNYVTFPQPIDLEEFTGADALLVGYDYTQTQGKDTDFPLLVNDVEGEYSLIYEGVMEGSYGLYDYSPTGSLCVQFICEGDIPDYDIIAESMIFDKHAMTVDAQNAVMVYLYNYGLKGDVRNVSFDVLIDNEKVQTLTQRNVSTTPLGYIFNVAVPDDVKPGVHDLTVKATAVGSAPLTANLDDDAISMKFTAITDNEKVERDLHLVEHFTSVDCMWCPRGDQFLQALCDHNPKITVVSVHGNMGQQDPYCTDEGKEVIKKLGITAFPGAAVNRIAFDDGSYSFRLLFQEDERNYYLGLYEQYLKDYSEVCIAPIALQAVRNENGDYLNIDVTGEGSPYLREVLSDCVLNVYVVENGLINRQLDENGNVNPVCVHNNVMRRRPTGVDGNRLSFDSASSYHNRLKVPISKAWQTEDLEVVAFITRVTENAYGRGVINATRVHVIDSAEGIETVATDAAPAILYDLSGRVAQPSAHGVFIQGGKKVVR